MKFKLYVYKSDVAGDLETSHRPLSGNELESVGAKVKIGTESYTLIAVQLMTVVNGGVK